MNTAASLQEMMLSVPLALPPSSVKPLPYAGAKTREVWKLAQFLPKRIDAVFEPFCGSAAFTFHLLNQGLEKGSACFLSDSNADLIHFYSVLASSGSSLMLRLMQLEAAHGLGTEALFAWACAVLKAGSADSVERAAAYYALKHLVYAGKEEFSAGSFCDPTKSKKGLKRQAILLLPLFGKLLHGVSVAQRDYKNALAEAPFCGKHSLVFLDPPYTGSEKTGCYAENVACLNELAEQCRVLAQRCKFMLTLDDCPENRARFRDFNIISRETHQRMGHRNAPELLITNFHPPLLSCAVAQTGWQPVPEPANDNAVVVPKGTPPLPSTRYEVILADPPWPYYGSETKPGAAARHYSLMDIEQIKALDVRSIIQERAVCFLWCTSPMLGYAADVFRAWGFTYNNIAFVWAKTRKDGGLCGAAGPMPSYTKTQGIEYLLVGSTAKRGKAPWPGVSVRGAGMTQLVLANRGRHSEKPALFRDLIVQLIGDRPRIELFARQRAAGWDAWGNEAP